MSVEEDDDKGQRDAYWRARESADDERETAPDVVSGGADEAPAEQEPNPFATAFTKAALGRSPSEYEQPPEPEPEFEPEPYSPSTPTAKPTGAAAAPDRAAKYDSALADVRRIASEPTPGVDIGAIEAGQRARNNKTASNDFTRAIQAWMFRKPFEPSAPTDAEDALTVQSLKAKQAGADKAQRLSAAEMVAKALRGEKAGSATPGALSEYQKYEMDRNARLDAEKKTKAETSAASAAAQLERDRGMLQKDFPDYDLSKADEKTIAKLLSLRHAKAAESQAAATLAENKEQHISQQTHELTKELGDPTTFDAQYARIQELIANNGGAVPGAGKLEALKQDSVMSPLLSGFSSNEAVEGRKLIKQLGNNYVHAITGAGVSNMERAQLQSASVDINSSDDRQIILGLKTLKAMYDAKVQAAKAGVRPEAAARIDAATQPTPNASPPRPKWAPEGSRFVKGKWMYRLPNGEIETAHEE